MFKQMMSKEIIKQNFVIYLITLLEYSYVAYMI